MTETLTAPSSAGDQATKDFESRHQDELGMKRFVSVQMRNMFLPLATAAIGGLVGYFTLGKAVRVMAPGLVEKANTFEDVYAALKDTATKLDVPEKIGKLGREFNDITDSPSFKKKLEELNNSESKNTAKEAGDNGHASYLKTLYEEIKGDPAKVKKFRNILGMKESRADSKMPEWIGAGVGGTIGSIGGSVFVGYEEWKKDESARLAAQEVNKSIAELELFKPSDPEILEENKRLRTMLHEKEQQRSAEHPTHHVQQAHAHGQVKAPELQQAQAL